jgi:hypothetical protein
MVTIFTTPKPFTGHSKVIQYNAIKSWSLLRPKPQIIIFGKEEGTAEIVAELGLTQLPDVELSPIGTPLVSSMFSLAHHASTNPLLCFVNADIMLTSSFIEALRNVSASTERFIMTGKRTLVDLDTPWDFDQPDWEKTLHQYMEAKGTLDSWVAMDYFAFPRGLYSDPPPFIVGRARWDNWMIYSALKRGIPVVDATGDMLAIHQNHDYSHLQGGQQDCFVSPEGIHNQKLYGLETCIGTLDATHLLRNGQLHRPTGWEPISRRLDTLKVLHPAMAPLAWPLLAARQIARPLRRMVGRKPPAIAANPDLPTSKRYDFYK